jgi:HPt (histidine-containing phosphotransfer) domain-containing protein
MTVKEFYENINGSYQNALSTMMNDDFIKKMLNKFLQTNSITSLFEAYKEKDFQKVFAAGHSLKGVLGNLALDPLYNKVVPIVEKTRNIAPNSRVDLDSEINDFQNEYNLVISELKKLLEV